MAWPSHRAQPRSPQRAASSQSRTVDPVRRGYRAPTSASYAPTWTASLSCSAPTTASGSSASNRHRIGETGEPAPRRRYSPPPGRPRYRQVSTTTSTTSTGLVTRKGRDNHRDRRPAAAPRPHLPNHRRQRAPVPSPRRTRGESVVLSTRPVMASTRADPMAITGQLSGSGTHFVVGGSRGWSCRVEDSRT